MNVCTGWLLSHSPWQVADSGSGSCLWLYIREKLGDVQQRTSGEKKKEPRVGNDGYNEKRLEDFCLAWKGGNRLRDSCIFIQIHLCVDPKDGKEQLAPLPLGM